MVKLGAKKSHIPSRPPLRVRISDEVYDTGRWKPGVNNYPHGLHKFAEVGRQEMNHKHNLQGIARRSPQGNLPHLDCFGIRGSSANYVLSGRSRKSSEESDKYFTSDSAPTKYLICQPPKVKSSPPRKPGKSVFVRIDYRKDVGGKNCGVEPSGIQNGSVGLSYVPGKSVSTQEKGVNVLKTLGDGCVGAKEFRVPYVNLGFRCDSREFIEQQASTSLSKCDLEPIERNFVSEVYQKGFVPQTAMKIKESPGSSQYQKKEEMIRIDYARTHQCDREEDICEFKPLRTSMDWVLGNSESADCGVKRSVGSCDSDDRYSECSFTEKLVLANSSDEEADDPSCSHTMTPEICQIVNVPYDVMAARRKENGLMILDGERFLGLVVKMLNKSGFSCHECGSMLNGSSMIQQLHLHESK